MRLKALANARQLKPYLRYLQLVLESGADTEEVRTVLSLRKSGTVISLDIGTSGTIDQDKRLRSYHETREDMLFDNLPVIHSIKVLSVGYKTCR